MIRRWNSWRHFVRFWVVSSVEGVGEVGVGEVGAGGRGFEMWDWRDGLCGVVLPLLCLRIGFRGMVLLLWLRNGFRAMGGSGVEADNGVEVLVKILRKISKEGICSVFVVDLLCS